MATKVRLLIIDPQVDFCDAPADGQMKQPGALAVPGAYYDLRRLAAMIDRLGMKIDDIDVTLDSHHKVDIAHPIWWMDRNGQSPDPFTLITVADVEAGIWTPRQPSLRQHSLDYVRQLAAKGKYVLTIWPEHCLIGSPGHAVHPELFASLDRWISLWGGRREMATINYVTKGSNPKTEHYSAMQAEVPDPTDHTTMMNYPLIKALQESDVILIAGEAESHCVKSTVEDIAAEIGPEHVRKFVYLRDCSSPVPAVPNGPDFPAIGKAFIADMQARGMKVTTSTEFLA